MPSTPSNSQASGSNRKKRQLSADEDEMMDVETSPVGRRRDVKALAKGKKRVRGEAGVDSDGFKETKKEDEEQLDVGVLLGE
jgi:hypothetical protein